METKKTNASLTSMQMLDEGAEGGTDSAESVLQLQIERRVGHLVWNTEPPPQLRMQRILQNMK